jgi:23S rRNA pseudouridine1911/1915/1917 synthase
VVHPAPGHLTGTLVNALLAHCPELGGIGGVSRPGIVHRLDQDTSGVMVAAKSQRAMDALVRAFSSHTAISKTYLAVVHGVPSPPEGRLENLIGRCPFDRKKMAVVERNGKNAVTLYKVLGTNPLPDAAQPLTLVECAILTGRTHQIRVHMASSLGSPIAGDAVYGRPGWDKRLSPRPMRQLLHARRLSLAHPVTRQPLVLEAPLPADFRPYLPAEF